MIEVDLVEKWFLGLDPGSQQQVAAALDMLGEEGPQLGRPVVDTVSCSRFRNMKELRPGSTGRSEIRILFAFDPRRHAILLIAGDKSGEGVKWYDKNIPRADALWQEHLDRLRRP
ncbi:type II toxin-antitoxin system RelE/ParE family toxin [Microbacterium indicum]|uniref:type II toxin-antitoxin system RelE/ParE family toxin n=1 Tax=Microbacterium indicum TaxID=358100 RepID=UPI001FDEB70D|nr:type II toxin-antitoxin system RelE/ParE family toxin [Microbacterium indicum]